MASGTAEKLYSPTILGLAVELARYPLDTNLPFLGRARSQSCGSSLSLSLETDDNDTIRALGMQVSACAIGQASAAIFARHAIGLDAAAIGQAHAAIAHWLEGEGPAPNWPDIDLIAPARAYPARHGAMLLPWKAAEVALSKAGAAR
ncbi:MAG: iron-sulfur cluster assembly scaffold protein [Sphingomonadaceae bacterium]|nr:MAG: iron-sulfur cluster assembly scaffold protein [Sphingomonadaceae bacterium]